MRPSWVEIDLGAISHNVGVLKEAVAPAAVCTVVKADGYGHGDVPVAAAALEAGADLVAVALVEEGIRLREAGIGGQILILSEPTPAGAKEVVSWGLTPTAYSFQFLEALAAAAAEPLDVHLKVNTGMQRVGADPEEALQLAIEIAETPLLNLAACWTHLAVAETDVDYTRQQLDGFAATIAALEEKGLRPPVLHAANSAGGLNYPAARYDMIRFGICTYGLRPAANVGAELDLRPAMRVVSTVSYTRHLSKGERPSYGRRRALPANSNVATVPVGYADGLNRRYGEVGGEVLIGGHRHSFAGTVTMDQIVIDCGDYRVAVGDEVVLLGGQADEEITADEWAAKLGTINYEIVCRWGPRLPRRYLS